MTTRSPLSFEEISFITFFSALLSDLLFLLAALFPKELIHESLARHLAPHSFSYSIRCGEEFLALFYYGTRLISLDPVALRLLFPSRELDRRSLEPLCLLFLVTRVCELFFVWQRWLSNICFWATCFVFTYFDVDVWIFVLGCTIGFCFLFL